MQISCLHSSWFNRLISINFEMCPIINVRTECTVHNLAKSMPCVLYVFTMCCTVLINLKCFLIGNR